jgi:glycosyltransferase involved in cell wall biosynthesis
MLAYNIEEFIQEALESVLAQKVDFEIEVVIGDDCSTDSTRDICDQYLKRYPSVIRLVTSDRNTGLVGNQMRILEACKGRYLALCDGDDYWTDPRKLQMQIDFLEKNPEYSFTFHDCLILYQESGKSARRVGKRKIDSVVDLRSVLIENNIPTSAVVCKNILVPRNFPEWVHEVPGKLDYSEVILLAEKGLGKYFPDPMSVYRIRQQSVWSTQAQHYRFTQNKKYWELLLQYFDDPELKKAIRGRINLCNFDHAVSLMANGDVLKSAALMSGTLRFYRDRRLRPKFARAPLAFASSIKRRILGKK